MGSATSPRRIIAIALAVLLAALSARHAHAETVLITGSNRGIGLAFATAYADRGWTVIATARSPGDSAELKALAAKHKTVALERLDVTDEAGIAALAAK